MLSKKTVKHSYATKKFNQAVQLPDINEKFIEACENGDIKTVSYILQNIKEFNIELTDNLGRSPLRLAVENEHLEIVQILLAKSDSQKIRDALLLAIYLGHTSIAESILKHPKYKILNEKKFLDGDQDSFWQRPSSDDAQFSPDITPVMLAAQYNRTEIVQMLLLNGDRISKPHDFNCKCTECLNKFKFDSLRHAQSRLNAYKGLASESYISLASIDPILTAFQLSRELGILAEREKYFKHEYLQLRNALSTYSVKLLNNVRGRDELDIVLNKTGKEKEEKYDKLARLDLAIRFKEKPFVAHSNCQQKLVEIWYTGVRRITKMNPIVIILLTCLHILLLPVTSLFYIVVPRSKIGRFLALPCVKFISHFASYLAFICMIISSSVKFAYEESSAHNLHRFEHQFHSVYSNYTDYLNRTELGMRPGFKDFYIRPCHPSTLDVVISIWIIGQTWHEIKKLIENGIYAYLFSSLNILSFSLNVIYIASFSLKYYTMWKVMHEKDKLHSNFFWHKLGNLHENDTHSQIEVFETFYWLNRDRFYWKTYDPINLSEGLFAIATVLTFAKLCFFLPISQQLGPLQITMGKMINDIIKFICIFSIVFTSFLFALNNLYWYYNIEIRSKVETKMPVNTENGETETYTTQAEEAFGTIGKALRTLFFALYLIGDSKFGKIAPFKSYITEGIGYAMFALFHIANVTILMSMLIAMMTKSYENIIHHSDTEWKFARSILYMEYIRPGFTLPIPLNLIPTPVTFYYSIRRSIANWKKRREIRANSMAASTNQQFDDLTIHNELKSQGSFPNIHTHHSTAANGGASTDLHRSKRLDSDKKQDDFVFAENNKLTHAIVMERVVKRYLMHNQGEIDDIKLNDFDDLKQDLVLMKNEFINDIYKSKDDILKNVFFLTNSIKFIAEDILLNSMTSGGARTESHEKYRVLMNFNETLLNSTSTQSLDESAPSTPTPGKRASFQSETAMVLNNNDKNESLPVSGGGGGGETSSTLTAPVSSSVQPAAPKKKIDFIDNLLAAPKGAAAASPTSKVTFDINENRYMTNNNSLYKIVEETTNWSSNNDSNKF